MRVKCALILYAYCFPGLNAHNDRNFRDKNILLLRELNLASFVPILRNSLLLFTGHGDPFWAFNLFDNVNVYF